MPQHGCPRVLPLLTRTAACAVGSIRQSPTEVVVSPNEHDVMALQEEVLTITIEQLQHSKSALDATPMPTDLPDDEPSEAETLSFN